MTDTMTLQEIFDKVATHLITQNAKSEDTIYCRYRSPDGLMCAVGCLIKDDVYTANIENYDVTFDTVRDALTRSGIVFEPGDNTEEFLMELQFIHDTIDIEKWKEYLSDVAKNYTLEIPDILKD